MAGRSQRNEGFKKPILDAQIGNTQQIELEFEMLVFEEGGESKNAAKNIRSSNSRLPVLSGH